MRDVGIDRRRFLLSGLATAAGLSLGGECELAPTPFEGVYTDRFSYRQGEAIAVACSLRNPQPVQLELVARHSSTIGHVSFHPAAPPNRGNAVDAGVLGARFQVVTVLDSGQLEPGLYELRLPEAHLLPENRTNEHHAFVSRNTIKTHLRRVYRKLNASSREEAVVVARDRGLLQASDDWQPSPC